MAPWWFAILVPAVAGILVAALVGTGRWLAKLVKTLGEATQGLAALTERVGSVATTVQELQKPIERLGRDLYRTQVDFRAHVRDCEEWRVLYARRVPDPRVTVE